MLTLALIQTNLAWENRAENLKHLTAHLDAIPGPVDLIVLPEMFSTGFSMQPERFAETMSGAAVEWMQQKAAEKQAAITGSLMMQDGAQYKNRLLFVTPDGKTDWYDKQHLFSMGEENRHYTRGEQRKMVNYKGYNILTTVCYDLRFPRTMRRTSQFNYDLLLVVANWPERRSMHWKTLLRARAIENQAFVAGVNRVGDDGNGISHTGDSMLLNAKGEILFEQSNAEVVKVLQIDKNETNTFREGFNVMADDPFWSD